MGDIVKISFSDGFYECILKVMQVNQSWHGSMELQTFLVANASTA